MSSSSGTDLSSSLLETSTNSAQEEKNLLLPRDRGTKKTDESTKDDDNDDKNNNEDVEAVVVTTKKTDNAAAAATDGRNKSHFRFFLLCLMVCQNSATVLVGRYLRSAIPREEQFVVNHFVCIAEITKLLLSCAIEQFTSPDGLWRSLHQTLWVHPVTDTLKISIPALLYLVQNFLLYLALSNLSAPLFQVTYQGKLVTTAVFSVLLLPNRRYTIQQWICLVVLSSGVAIVILAEQQQQQQQKVDTNNNNNENTLSTAGPIDDPSLMIGLMCVAASCISSALAGVYFEMVLKDKTGKVSLWMRNIQLAFFSILLAVMQGLGNHHNNDKDGHQETYFHGFNGWTWVLVGLQAGGGLLVAAVMKHADNVLKGLATGVSVVVATTFSISIFHTPFTMQFVGGATLILASVYFFSATLTLPPQPCRRLFLVNQQQHPPIHVDPQPPQDSSSNNNKRRGRRRRQEDQDQKLMEDQP